MNTLENLTVCFFCRASALVILLMRQTSVFGDFKPRSRQQSSDSKIVDEENTCKI